jgi:hypothetical protein
MFKQQLGRIYIAERKAKEQGLDKKPGVRVQTLLQESRVLAQEYARESLQEKMKASRRRSRGLFSESSGT